MLLTISTLHEPATDLGYLLHKNPARVQTDELSFGKAHVFYPDASPSLCTVALLLEMDPVALVRGRGAAGEGGQLDQYVNDRPYAANSFLSVAMGRLFTTAMSGRSKERPELAERKIPLSAHLPVIAARGGAEIVRQYLNHSATRCRFGARHSTKCFLPGACPRMSRLPCRESRGCRTC